MKMKAISPLVAVIMLIAFTLIVGGILASWATQFAETQRATVQRCMDARVILQNGIYDSATKNLTLVVYNYGDVDLEFIPIIQYSNLSRHPSGTVNLMDERISSSAGTVVTHTLQNIDDDLEQITIQSTDCTPPCYKCPGAQDTLLNINIRGL
jgi:flagellin-like protein